jgi:NADH-quinone oxidoreductase subunit C
MGDLDGDCASWWRVQQLRHCSGADDGSVDVYVAGCPPAPRRSSTALDAGRKGGGLKIGHKITIYDDPGYPITHIEIRDAMDEYITNAINAITERYAAQASEFRGQVTLLVDPERIVDTCRVLRDEFGFEMLAAQTAVDYWPEQAPRFHIIYQLNSLSHNRRLCLRVPVDGNAPMIPTIENVYPNANWHEREIYDMFGIRFEGHSDLRRILMPAIGLAIPCGKITRWDMKKCSSLLTTMRSIDANPTQRIEAAERVNSS